KLDVEKAGNEEIASALEGKTVVIKLKAGQNGKLFGSVKSSDVSNAIKEQYNINVDKKKIGLNGEIKAFGDYNAVIKMSQGVSCSIKVNVIEA
ncbi:MAG: 50S ribosomal protein L9, partial [Oscillospiraceae bacterium]